MIVYTPIRYYTVTEVVIIIVLLYCGNDITFTIYYHYTIVMFVLLLVNTHI